MDHGGRETIGKMTWEDIARLELFVGSPIGSGVIILPEMYMPAGLRRKLAARTIVLFPAERPKSPVIKLREEWIGRAALSLWLPRRSRGQRTLSPPSWREYTRLLVRLIAAAEPLMSSGEWDFWPRFQVFREESYRGLTNGFNSIDKCNRILDILEENSRSKIMFAPTQRVLTANAGAIEGSYSDQPEKISRPKELPGGKFQPFPNVFVSKLMRICLWVQDNLADQFLDCWQRAQDIPRDARYCEAVARKRLRRAQTELFATFPWKDSEGNAINSLPFDIHQRKSQHWELSQEWPPTSHSTITTILGLLQACNASVLAFCTGGRHHEIAGMSEEAIVEELIHSSTYKFSRRIGGVEREWPLHPIAERAIAIQERLASLVRTSGAQHLWVQLKKSPQDEQGTPLANLTQQAHQIFSYMGLDECSDGTIHLHRWRHTIARLIGITVDEAQEVIMDLFGHASVEAGLIYLLSHPDVAADAIRVSEEAALVLAKDALREVEQGTAGGQAAERLFVALEDYKMRRGILALGTDDIDEAAHLLTIEGTAFRRVRGGILCTKAVGQPAPCIHGRGREDIGSCSSRCDKRLELQVERKAFAVELTHMARQFVATSRDQLMIRAHLSGQLLAQSRRWPKEGRAILESLLPRSDVAEIFCEAA
jgi:integrase